MSRGRLDAPHDEPLTRTTISTACGLALTLLAPAAGVTGQSIPPPPAVSFSTELANYVVRESHAFFGAERRAWMETSVRLTFTLRRRAVTVEASGLVLKTAGDDGYGSGTAPAGSVPGAPAPGRPVRAHLDKASVRLADIGGSSLAITAGRQHITIGSQFLIGDGVYDGFSPGTDQAVYHSPRKGFDALRAQWTATRLAFDAFLFRVDPTWDGGGRHDGLVGGVDVSGESARSKGRYAAGLFYRYSKSDLDNDMTLVNVRATQPVPGAHGAYVGGELVWEFGGHCRNAYYCTAIGQPMNEQAWHAEVGFSAETRPFKPAGEIGYVRYSRDFTPLATGFSDWGRWYLGNQIDWMIFSTDSSIVRGELGFRPHPTVRVRGQVHHTGLVSAGDSDPRSLANEACLIVEWSPSAAVWVNLLAGSSHPGAGLGPSGLGNPFAALNSGAAPSGTRASFDVVVAVGFSFNRGW